MFMTSRESAIVPFPFHRIQAPLGGEPTLGENSLAQKLPSSEFWCAEHISTGKDMRSGSISVFFLVLCLFSGNYFRNTWIVTLYVGVNSRGTPFSKGGNTGKSDPGYLT